MYKFENCSGTRSFRLASVANMIKNNPLTILLSEKKTPFLLVEAVDSTRFTPVNHVRLRHGRTGFSICRAPCGWLSPGRYCRHMIVGYGNYCETAVVLFALRLAVCVTRLWRGPCSMMYVQTMYGVTINFLFEILDYSKSIVVDMYWQYICTVGTEATKQASKPTRCQN